MSASRYRISPLGSLMERGPTPELTPPVEGGAGHVFQQGENLLSREQFVGRMGLVLLSQLLIHAAAGAVSAVGWCRFRGRVLRGRRHVGMRAMSAAVLARRASPLVCQPTPAKVRVPTMRVVSSV